MVSGIYLVRCASAAHFGIGQGIGSVDQPTARAAQTDLPFAPASSCRGVLRADCAPASKDGRANAVWLDLFGPEFADTAQVSGILCMDDARLLVYPVRSRCGLVVWATSPRLLLDYSEALTACGLAPPVASSPELQSDECLASSSISVSAGQARRVFAADLDYACGRDDNQVRQEWAAHLVARYRMTKDFAAYFSARFAIFPDEAMLYLTQFCTDVRARVLREMDGTVSDQALWYEEYLPEGSLFFGEWSAQPVPGAQVVKDMAAVGNWLRGEALDGLPAPPTRLQLGGKAATNKGRIELQFSTKE